MPSGRPPSLCKSAPFCIRPRRPHGRNADGQPRHHPRLSADPRLVRGRGGNHAFRHPRSQFRASVSGGRGARLDCGVAPPRGRGRLHGGGGDPHHRPPGAGGGHARARPRQSHAGHPVRHGRTFAGHLPRRPARAAKRAPRGARSLPVQPPRGAGGVIGQICRGHRICRANRRCRARGDPPLALRHAGAQLSRNPAAGDAGEPARSAGAAASKLPPRRTGC